MILLSTAYCPPVIYMAQFFRDEEILIEKEETYPKQSWRNRCSIYTANGKLNLSIPVSKPAGNKTKTSNILICTNEKWNLEHWRAIESAYSNSPFFLYYKDELMPLFMHVEKNLLEHNDRILNTLFGLAGISVNYSYTHDYIRKADGFTDLRDNISPKKKFTYRIPVYDQVFAERFGFLGNLSVLDLLFNKGPDAISYLKEVARLNYLD